MEILNFCGFFLYYVCVQFKYYLIMEYGKKNYYIVTIDREKNIVKHELIAGWANALMKLSDNENKARTDGWKTYPSENRYEFPKYVRKYRGCSFFTSFSMVNGKRDEGGKYYFTYIKAA